jgi:hypothetical protein
MPENPHRQLSRSSNIPRPPAEPPPKLFPTACSFASLFAIFKPLLGFLIVFDKIYAVSTRVIPISTVSAKMGFNFPPWRISFPYYLLSLVCYNTRLVNAPRTFDSLSITLSSIRGIDDATVGAICAVSSKALPTSTGYISTGLSTQLLYVRCHLSGLYYTCFVNASRTFDSLSITLSSIRGIVGAIVGAICAVSSKALPTSTGSISAELSTILIYFRCNLSELYYTCLVNASRTFDSLSITPSSIRGIVGAIVGAICAVPSKAVPTSTGSISAKLSTLRLKFYHSNTPFQPVAFIISVLLPLMPLLAL